ncbi:MAG: tyrosine-type recombinase/integrase [Pseudonocardiaceae bacterium]
MRGHLDAHVDDYLRLRRALGYRLEREERWLRQLVEHVQAAGSPSLTSELVISWARLPATAQPRHWAARLGCARKFARFLHTIDPATQIPPAGVFPAHRHRPMPYLWSAQEIEQLLGAAAKLRPPLRGLTHQALFGLLAVSGMRLGEAIGLRRDDVDFNTAVITIRHAKFDRSRIVPLHPTVSTAARLRQPARPTVPSTPFRRVLPVQQRHRPGPQPGRQDAAAAHHQDRYPHRNGASTRTRPPTQFRRPQFDRLDA